MLQRSIHLVPFVTICLGLGLDKIKLFVIDEILENRILTYLDLFVATTRVCLVDILDQKLR